MKRFAAVLIVLLVFVGCGDGGKTARLQDEILEQAQTTTTQPAPPVVAEYENEYGDHYDVVRLPVPNSEDIICVTWTGHGETGSIFCFTDSQIGE